MYSEIDYLQHILLECKFISTIVTENDSMKAFLEDEIKKEQ